MYRKQEPARVSVKRSQAGLGLFADQVIEKGQFVIEYTGEIITNDEADRRANKYLFEINTKWTMDGSGRENIARYINHSCRPNCETDVIKHTIKVYAKRKIQPGEELTYDYGKSYVDEYIKPHGCKCNKCRTPQDTSQK
ncbi:MAG: SET domain-containing protein-lysine N-methyltransferase [Candidatus Paceibacterota bacterium]